MSFQRLWRFFSSSYRNAKRRVRSRERTPHCEPLEPRHLLSGNGGAGADDVIPFEATPVANIASIDELQAAEIERAFKRVSDLERYTEQQMAAVTRWVIRVEDGYSPAQLADDLGVATVEAEPLLADTFHYSMPAGTTQDDAVVQMQSTAAIEYFYPLVPLNRQLKLVPNDPFLDDQWHLINTATNPGTPGEDAQVESAWDKVTGNGVVIAIVDGGMDYNHEDLAPHYRSDLSYDFLDNDADPSPGDAFDDHATSVAGVAAAVGDNGIGVAGAAWEAEIASLRLVGDPEATDAQEADALVHRYQDIDIYNNSWGPVDGFDWMDSPGPLTMAALQDGVDNGRGGLGSIYTWAAGNGLTDEDDVNYDGYANSRYTIAVGAIGSDGVQSWFSEPGAAMLITTQSEGVSGGYGDAGYDGIVTTDRTGDDGYNSAATAGTTEYPDPNYTGTFSGTSSSTPLAAGLIALILEANPNLTYRDVEHILVETARKNDPGDSDWTTNGAGYDVNHKYGFGAIDAAAAVTAAETWQKVSPEAGFGWQFDFQNTAIPDDGSVSEATLPIPDDITIEYVEIVVNIDHPVRANLNIEIESPSGTVSVLAEERPPRDLFDNLFFIGDFGSGYTDWAFSSVRHWGESSQGDWKLRVSDTLAGDEGTFQDVTLIFYGNTGATGFVEGAKFVDINGNKQLDAGEGAGAGFVIFADENGNGNLDPSEPSAVTLADGSYQLRLLPDTVYTIREQPRDGWTQTYPETLTYPNVSVTDQEVLGGIDFGNDPDPFTIAGMKWADLNSNAKHDAGEPGLGGIEIYLDLNNNGKLDGGEPSTQTRFDGVYQLTADLGPGTYTVAEVELDGLLQTYPVSGTHSVTVDAGERVTGIKFGNKPIPGSLAGIVHYDADGDGSLDGPGLAGVTVFVDLNGDGLLSITEPAAVTGRDGSFRFDDLFAGNYILRQGGRDSGNQTYPGAPFYHEATVAPNEVTYLDFANRPLKDYGDAPDPYPRRARHGRAVHDILPGYHLGPGFNDDGVIFETPLIPGEFATMTVDLTQKGQLDDRPVLGYFQGWIDYNGDGDWRDPGEQVFRNYRLARGENTLKIRVPSGAVAGPTYARFRLAFEPNLKEGGNTVAGETEDYPVSIQASATVISVIGSSQETGEWVQSVNAAGGATQQSWGDWANLGEMLNVVSADFTGDGLNDVAGRDALGRWWVNENTDNGFVLRRWAKWAARPGWWESVLTGDVNSDGNADLIGFNGAGMWWVAYSTGRTFRNYYVGSWPTHLGDWHSLTAADFTGDNVPDLLGRTDKGHWRLSQFQSNGTLSHDWVGKWRYYGNGDAWSDIVTGDYDNDGDLDFLGYNENGEWQLARNDGIQNGRDMFANVPWGTWSMDTPWRHVVGGDFTGDGHRDVLAIDEDGVWTLGFNAPWHKGLIFIPYGVWDSDREWTGLLVADFDHDGDDDVLGLNDLGQWRLGQGGGERLISSVWGDWGDDHTWGDLFLVDVN